MKKTPRNIPRGRDAIGDDDLHDRVGAAALRAAGREAKTPTLTQIEALIKRAIKEMEPAQLPDLTTVEGPKDRAAFVELVNKGVSRALSLASTAKEVADAVKSATWWFKVCYDVKEDEPYGGALGGGDA